MLRSPVQVKGLTSGVASLETGNNTTCAKMAADGTYRCWGPGNAFGGGQGIDHRTPQNAVKLNAYPGELSLGNSVGCIAPKDQFLGIVCTGWNNHYTFGAGYKNIFYGDMMEARFK